MHYGNKIKLILGEGKKLDVNTLLSMQCCLGMERQKL
jgi:hypothetical protein